MQFEMLPAKRQRTQVSKSEAAPELLKLPPPPASYLGRVCRLRWPAEPQVWVSARLLKYMGADKQSCEIELLDGDPAAKKMNVKKIHLPSQALHVLVEVAWAPADEECAEDMPDRVEPSAGEGLGAYVGGLTPMLIFAPLGRPDIEAEDGHVLAQNLAYAPAAKGAPAPAAEYTWVRPETTRALLAGMLKRRTTPAMRKGVDVALDFQRALNLPRIKALKKSAAGKRLAVYWPIDDAW